MAMLMERDWTGPIFFTTYFLEGDSGWNLFSLSMERRARTDRATAWALIIACTLWRVAATLFRTRYPLTRACILTNPLSALRAFRAWMQHIVKSWFQRFQ